jgi:hypothetical protein
MSEAAISDWQLAAAGSASPTSPIAYRLLPIAALSFFTALDAVFCTVTSTLTSVTNRGLANGVLIQVSEVQLAQRQWIRRELVSGPCQRPMDCSFGDELCIQ